MKCPKCEFNNRFNARFCARCGSPLAPEPGADFSPVPRPELLYPEREPSSSPPPASPSPVPAVLDPSPRSHRLSAVWGLITAAVTCPLALCLVVGLALAPALDASAIPAPPESNPSQPDLTLRVAEAYLNEAAAGAVPGTTAGETFLDVRPGNALVTTVDFDLLLINLRLIITARISVEAGRITLAIDSIETGGRNVLDLIGVSGIAVGEGITTAVQEQLEAELGPGARLLDITTTEDEVVITARWE